MRRPVIALSLCIVATTGVTAATIEGRWEGLVRVPGREFPLVVDLASGSAGTWTGSIIIPALGVNGAPLDKIAVADANLTFVIVNALASEAYGPAQFRGQLSTDGVMAGEMRQAGNVGAFAMNRSGQAQVQLPQHSTAVGRDLENQWIGEFELGGYPRHVTITFANHDNAGATATFVVVGKQTNNLPVDLVLQEGDLLRIESQANQVVFEGRLRKESGEIKGTLAVGSLELPLVLRRSTGRNS